uniref:PFU domain-containing protein n=2 Tax=Auxenochlorella protothecoides TaxID=3075 RepID=A0A1D1ZUM1_AUXPR
MESEETKSLEDPRPVLLVTTVDIGDGVTGRVEVRLGDDPEDAARAFCATNGLPESVVLPLTAHLQSNLDLGPPSEQDAATGSVAPAQAISWADGDVPAQTPRDPLSQQDLHWARPPGQGSPPPHPDAGASRGTGGVTPAWGPGSSAPPQGTTSCVHERLYHEHFRQQLKLEEARRLRDLELQLRMAQVHLDPVSQSLSAARTPDGYTNYGERLYVEGRLEALKREQAAARRREAEEAAQLECCTFVPEMSLTAAAKRDREARMGSQGQRSHGPTLSSKFESRMAELRRAKAASEVKECTFAPTLNRRSQNLTSHRSSALKEAGVQYYDRLYLEAERRRHKLEAAALELPAQVTFAPKILRSSVVLRRLNSGRADAELAATCLGRPPRVEARLLERGERYAARAEASRAAARSALDPATGRRLFVPETCRSPRGGLGGVRGGSIGEHLYGVAAQHAKRAAAQAEAERRRAERDAASTFVNASSQRMVEALKRERFGSIFAYLAGDDAADADLDLCAVVQDEEFMDTIDPEVRADVEYAARLLQTAAQSDGPADDQDTASQGDGQHPLAASPASPDRELQTPNAAPQRRSALGPVSLELFCVLMEEVLAQTKGIARTYLLPLAPSRKKFEEPTFQPQIDARSQALATRRRSGAPPAHEKLYATAGLIQRKLESKRAAAEAARLKECSFQPTMIARKGSVNSKSGTARSPGAAKKPDELADALEVEIKRALVRLSMSAGVDGEKEGELAPLDTIRAARASLDPSALFGPPSVQPGRAAPDLKWLETESETLVMDLAGTDDVAAQDQGSIIVQGQSLLSLAAGPVPSHL